MKITKKDKRTNLEKEIDAVICNLENLDEDSEEYNEVLSALERLAGVHEKLNSRKANKLSPDTVAIVVGNLLGIILILKYEKLDIITTKALGFVIKGRV